MTLSEAAFWRQCAQAEGRNVALITDRTHTV